MDYFNLDENIFKVYNIENDDIIDEHKKMFPYNTMYLGGCGDHKSLPDHSMIFNSNMFYIDINSITKLKSYICNNTNNIKIHLYKKINDVVYYSDDVIFTSDEKQYYSVFGCSKLVMYFHDKKSLSTFKLLI